jgi:hypothetical protein
MDDIRGKLLFGDHVMYRGEYYLVSGIDFLNGGHTMAVDLIKPTRMWPIAFVKTVYDEEIEKFTLLKK